ncbi:tumor necrosis factor receptor superfamily member 14-like isoform X2 [Sardina pilchardus]|uniref:tumor necrosis factor receptor superfamily member 14-like isoform X2 n=1 Tax=Sardina pilchardus TaxID=27697 RepID=UPI002E1210D9
MNLLIFGFLIAIFVRAAGSVCGPAEYTNNDGECCPMCRKGYVVREDCNEWSSTTCIPCVGDTYVGEPNRCFKCKSCDPNQGLYTLQKCTTFNDAVCDVLPGYYCERYTEDNECPFGVKHSVCSPGQGVKTPGTELRDTVCEDCKEGYFSINGINCTEHTNCAVLGEELEEKGSPIKDNKCRKPPRRRDGLIVPFLIFLILLLLLWRKLHIGCSYKLHIGKDVQTRNTTGSTTDQGLRVMQQETGECSDHSLPVENEDQNTEALSPQRTMSLDDELDDGPSK